VDYNVLENEEGGYKADGFARIDKALKWCRKNNLNVVLDLHKTAGFSFDEGEKESGFFDNEALQERFCRLWEEIARHYGNDPEHIAFELLNEITEPSFIETWNKISYECIRRIRAIAPETIILVGSYWNNHADAVKDLAAPFDANTLYNFHCYEPLTFTHQGAGWLSHILNVEDRFSFEESGVTEEFFEKVFAPAIEAAKQNNTELYCGEYGMIDVASPEDALKWYKAINRVLEKHGIARAAWTYKQMDFGISDARMDDVREELVKYL